MASGCVPRHHRRDLRVTARVGPDPVTLHGWQEGWGCALLDIEANGLLLARRMAYFSHGEWLTSRTENGLLLARRMAYFSHGGHPGTEGVTNWQDGAVP
jgi:hypothetical protein